MSLDVQDIALIDAIERLGSFASAADSLFRTRSAVTQRVQKLEQQLGFLLFDRSEYRPSLTPEGKIFLERGKPFLISFQNFKSEVAAIQQGWESEFTIAVDDLIPTANIFFLIEQFRKVAPQVTVQILREVLNGCWDALLDNRADLAIGAVRRPSF